MSDNSRNYMCSECQRNKKQRLAGDMRSKLVIDPETGMDVKSKENLLTGKVTKRNKSGVRGVYWHKGKQKWAVTGRANGKRIEIGAYKSISDAAKAREKFVKEVYGAMDVHPDEFEKC